MTSPTQEPSLVNPFRKSRIATTSPPAVLLGESEQSMHLTEMKRNLLRRICVFTEKDLVRSTRSPHSFASFVRAKPYSLGIWHSGNKFCHLRDG